MTGIGKGYIEMARISELLGPDDWPTHRVRRWMKRHNAAVLIGGRWYTTRSKLRAAFPEVYEDVFVGKF